MNACLLSDPSSSACPILLLSLTLTFVLCYCALLRFSAYLERSSLYLLSSVLIALFIHGSILWTSRDYYHCCLFVILARL